jgi:archaetidylinositol phosphate synthase
MSSVSEPQPQDDGTIAATAPADDSGHGSWTHRLARIAVRPLLGTKVTPNHLTTARLVSGLAACVLFAAGSYQADVWAGIFWVVSAFLDRADGELARIGGKTTSWGHAYDYACDTLVNALFFLAIGVGLSGGALGLYAIALGVLAGGGIVASNILSEAFEKRLASGTRIYAGGGGFDFDDLLYLLGPAAWLGWLAPMLIGGSFGAPLMAIISAVKLRQLIRDGAPKPS